MACEKSPGQREVEAIHRSLPAACEKKNWCIECRNINLETITLRPNFSPFETQEHLCFGLANS